MKVTYLFFSRKMIFQKIKTGREKENILIITETEYNFLSRISPAISSLFYSKMIFQKTKIIFQKIMVRERS